MKITERRHRASGLLAAVLLSALLAVAMACSSAQEPSAPQQPAAPAPAQPAAAPQQPSGMAPQAPQQPAAPAPAAAAAAAPSIPEAAPIGAPKVTKTRRVIPAMDEQMIQRGGTLQWVPQASLRTLDPVWTTAAMTHNAASQMYDAVFAWDSALQSQPQLVEEWSMTDDAKSYTFKIREGLTFHDGEVQTTDDVLASIARYEQRQPVGISIRQLGEPSYKKIDDVTFQMDMGKPFGLVPFFWGTWGTVYIFKEEIASATSPDVAIEADLTIGSGPFKFVSWEPGNRLIMERYEDYIPRTDAKDGAAGSKEAYLDRIVMSEVPDQATRVAALLTQQADFSEGIAGDLLPTLEDSPSVTVETISPWASPWLVFNHLHPPFNDQRARLAVQAVVNREEYMRAGYGPEFLWETCPALFMCGGPLASEAGSDTYYAEPNVELGKQLWQEYVSETGFDDPVIVLAATDYPDFFASGLITKRNLESIGAQVDMPSMDWAAVVARRAEKSLPAEGGWNIFHTWGGTFDPITAVGLSGNWFGWPQNKTIQGLIEEFPLAGTLEDQKRIADAIQEENYANPNYLTMGQFNFLVARQDYVKGYEPHRLLHFWGVWLDK